MIKYTALCSFTASINGVSKQFEKGEVYESEFANPQLDAYIQHGFCTKEEVETSKKPSTKKQ